MTAAFVPTFTRALTQQGREDAWRLGNLVINALLVVTGVLVMSRHAVRDADHRARSHPSSRAFLASSRLTAELTRVMLPFLPLIAVAVAAMGMLNALHRFFVPSLSPAMFNIATIACALGLAPLMPRFGQPPILAIAIGTLLGGLGQILLQWPLLAA